MTDLAFQSIPGYKWFLSSDNLLDFPKWYSAKRSETKRNLYFAKYNKVVQTDTKGIY